jgi:hypothetical protein
LSSSTSNGTLSVTGSGSAGTLLEKVHRIQDQGIEVWCGMIMGFDNDDSSIFDGQIEFIQQARIS